MYILVVEDDADVSKFLVTGLREVGHVVELTTNGRDSLMLAQTKHFDALIIDRQLPGGIDGVDMLKSLRNSNVHTPALFLSGLGQISDWMKGLQAGGDDYLVKPATLSEILRRLELITAPKQVAQKQSVEPD
ncbi:MAG: response regulator [Acidocella sp.]|nr:response regulator [Acidocella sp.]